MTEHTLKTPLPAAELKIGRGALSNPGNRFVDLQRETVDDGWWQDEVPARLDTQVMNEQIKTIISTNASPDISFSKSINPYRGCEHGCIYCYARPSHAYWDLSPGLDFETRIINKPDAARVLRETLSKPNYQVEPMMIGANTDPYQPVEARLKTTRQLIEVLSEFKHPFSLITKSSLVLRDLDLLAPLAQRNLCSVAVSVTTLDNDIKRSLEPRTAGPAARLKVIRQLSDAGVPVMLMVAPVIPTINDHEIEAILAAGYEAGARRASYIFLRLPREVSPLFRQWLDSHYPDRAEHAMNIITSSRGGKDYDAGFHQRMRGQGVFADLIKQRFSIAAGKLGFNTQTRAPLDCDQFVRANEQLALF